MADASCQLQTSRIINADARELHGKGHTSLYLASLTTMINKPYQNDKYLEGGKVIILVYSYLPFEMYNKSLRYFVHTEGVFSQPLSLTVGTEPGVLL